MPTIEKNTADLRGNRFKRIVLASFLLILVFGALAVFGTGKRTFAADKPGKVTGVSAKAVSSHAVKLKWKKVKGAAGYQIFLVTKEGRKKIATVKGASKTSFTVKKRKKDAFYSFQIRAYKKKAYGAYSKKVTVRVTVHPADYKYGVFLSVTKNLDQLRDYQTVVIDAQYFTKKEIDAFRHKGHKVYSYINIGSIEKFRKYYKTCKSLILGAYENWEEEFWVDVSEPKWQSLMRDHLIPALLAKGIDGFFVDNCDVYYHYPKKKILNGLTKIMHVMTATGKAVLINGGDAYLNAFCKSGGSWDYVITGINQETVFSKILWDKNAFGSAAAGDREYFQNYIENYAKKGAEIYLLEYTVNPKLIKRIRKYCKKNGFRYYVSDSIELDY